MPITIPRLPVPPSHPVSSRRLRFAVPVLYRSRSSLPPPEILREGAAGQNAFRNSIPLKKCLLRLKELPDLPTPSPEPPAYRTITATFPDIVWSFFFLNRKLFSHFESFTNGRTGFYLFSDAIAPVPAERLPPINYEQKGMGLGQFHDLPGNVSPN